MNKKNDLFKLIRLLILTNNLKSAINTETRHFLESLSNDYLNPTATTTFTPHPSLSSDELTLSLSGKRSRSTQLPNLDLTISVNSNYHTRLSSEEPQPKKSKLSFSDETASFKHIQSSSVKKYKSTLPVETSSSQPERPLEGSRSLSIHYPTIAKNQPFVSHKRVFRKYEKHPSNRKVQINSPVPKVRPTKTLKPVLNQKPKKVNQNLVLKIDKKISDQLPIQHFFFVPPKPTFAKAAQKLKAKGSCTLKSYKPSTIDGKVVLQAINWLQVPDKIKFFNLAKSSTFTEASTDIDLIEFSQLKICLKPSSSDQNGDALFKYYHQVKTARLLETMSPVEQQAETPQIRIQAVKMFALSDDSDKLKTISKYKTYVMSDFNQLFLDFPPEMTLMPDFLRAKTIFPLFLFYVDMINVIAPLETLGNEGESLGDRRKSPATYFFQALMFCFQENMEKHPYLEHRPGDAQVISDKMMQFKLHSGLADDKKWLTFIWKVLKGWMTVSEHFLLPPPDKPVRYLELFFNDMFTDWVFHQATA